MQKVYAIAALLLLIALPCHAAGDVEVELTGGTVRGKGEGHGTVDVEARVTNNGQRPLNGIRIRVFYNTENMGPGADARWQPHEFIFEPPLQPGKSSTLRFSDENGAQYVHIEVERLLIGEGLSYNGELVDLSLPLKSRGGAVYIATRDFANIIGAEAKFDPDKDLIVVEREGLAVRFQHELPYAYVGGVRTDLTHRVFTEDGTSFIPVITFAEFFEIDADLDPVKNIVELSE